LINVTLTDYSSLLCFWLVFTRWLTVIFQLPIFDSPSIPGIVKVLFSLIISYAFFPMLKPEIMKDIAYVGIDNFWVLTAFYAAVGLLMGYMVKTLMNVFTASGSIITQQIGFGAISYFDPQSAARVGPFEIMIQWTMIVIIVSSGALLPMFKGVFSSFFSIHFYDLGNLAQSTVFFIALFKSIILSSLLLASPIVFTNMLITSVLGIVARTVPQMNVIMVSFVVNIGVGLLVFAASSTEFFNTAFKIYTENLGKWFQFIS
jgi:flagellar biosynthetic protein FliR